MIQSILKLCFCLLAALILQIQSFAETNPEYYKTGELGVFRISTPLPLGLDPKSNHFFAVSDSKNLSLIFCESMDNETEELADLIQKGPYDPSKGLSEEDKKKLKEINRQINDLTRKSYEQQNKRAGLEAKISGLKGIIEDTKKEANPDQALVQKSEEKLKAAQEELDGLKKEDASRELSNLYQKQEELYRKRSNPLAEQFQTPQKMLTLCGRFHGTGKARVTVYARNMESFLETPSLIGTFNLDLPLSDSGDSKLLHNWAELGQKEFLLHICDSPFSSFYQYCLLVFGNQYGVKWNLTERGSFQENLGMQGPDLYSMSTGALAIQESLQLDRMRSIGQGENLKETDLSSLKGPDIKSHPFQEMLAGKNPDLFPVDFLIPSDQYYFHFSSIVKEIEASDLMKKWGTSLLRMMTVSARDADLPSRYLNQLCLSLSDLTRLFGDKIIGDVTLTGEDPFLREGTSLSLVIQLKNPKIMDAVMSAYSKSHIKNDPSIKTDDSTYEGISIVGLKRDDRKISSYSALLGDYRIYSNSLISLEKIIDVWHKKLPSLGESLDYRYMRTIYPANSELEDGFLFLPDPFIRKMISPTWKIEGERRMICQGNLRTLSNASLLHSIITGKALTGIPDLLEGKYLTAETVSCPDGGSYTVDARHQGACSVHNRLQYCTPIESVKLLKVSDKEAKAYTRFSENYNQYWSRYFDPVGIRLKLGNTLQIETCILPLIENSLYNQLRSSIGGAPVALNSKVFTDKTLLNVSLKLNKGDDKNTGLGQALTMASFLYPALPNVQEWIGESLSFGLFDSDVLFTLSSGSMHGFGMELNEGLFLSMAGSALTLPFYLVLDLKDEEKAGKLIRDMLTLQTRKSSLEENMGRREFLDEQMNSYQDAPYGKHEVKVVTLNFFVMKFRFYYAIASKKFILASKRYVLEKVLANLDHPDNEKVCHENLDFEVRPEAFRDILPSVRTGWQEQMREACLRNIEPVRVLYELFGAKPETLDPLCKEVEGVTLRCPCKGEYIYDPIRKTVYCSAHGNNDFPMQPGDITDHEGLIDFLSSLKSFQLSFRFTPEGIRTLIEIKRDKKYKAILI